MYFTAFVLLMDSFPHAIKKKSVVQVLILGPGQATANSSEENYCYYSKSDNKVVLWGLHCMICNS
jgi:hypothetical protein